MSTKLLSLRVPPELLAAAAARAKAEGRTLSAVVRALVEAWLAKNGGGNG